MMRHRADLRKEAQQGHPAMFLRGVCFCLLVLLRCSSWAEPEGVTNVAPAKLSVSGFGLLANRTVRSALLELKADRQAPVLDANFIEDAFLMLHDRLADEGYLNPMVVGNLTLTNGLTVALWWDGVEELQVPRDVQAVEAEFEVIPGVLFFYDELVFDGLHAITPARAQGLFITRDALLNLKTSRRFSTDHLQSSMRNLQRELENLGYRDATLSVKKREVDPETGQARVTIQVVEGPRYVVRNLTSILLEGTNSVPLAPPAFAEDQAYSLTWEQDAAQAVEVKYYQEGYPDAQTRIVEVNRSMVGDEVRLDLLAETTAGSSGSGSWA
jgi:outer membrane protein assembly factor BamA